MKVIQTKESTKFLTNAEVLAHIREVHARGLTNPQYGDREKARLRRLHAVVHETHDHFGRIGLATQPLPAEALPHDLQVGNAASPNGTPSSTLFSAESAHIPHVMTILNALPRSTRLTKQEKAMVCNLRPRTPEELECIIEESDERLGEERTQKLLEQLDACFVQHGWGDEKGGAEPETRVED